MFNRLTGPLFNTVDNLINWAHQNSLWPMFFGLSCCFIEECTGFTPRYDIARFGAEVLRGSPRQADLLIISGTVFKKAAPMIVRVYEQMAEPKWVISMGSCSNSGGMYDVYSVVQGINQLLPVDVYIPGCPPRPEAVLHGLVMLQEKIRAEKPSRAVFHLAGGTQGSETVLLEDGKTKSRDPRGPGNKGIPVRGNSVTPPGLWDNRADLMWVPPAHTIELGTREQALAAVLKERYRDAVTVAEQTSDMLTVQVLQHRVKEVLQFLKEGAAPRFQRLDDLTAIDESERRSSKRNETLCGTVGKEIPWYAARGFGEDANTDYTLVYHLLCFDPPSRIRLKVPLTGSAPVTSSITDIWPSANWYEREVYDMFGIRFEGHPDLRRLLMPPGWEGHPLRKAYPGRATEMSPFTRAKAEKQQALDDAAVSTNRSLDTKEMVLNIGPHHTGTHGLMRFIVNLSGEEITGIDMDIGYHHRAAEKIGERQSWHQFIPYTDRVDYLAGVANNLA
jgi:NADH-quinone oxidoreductase B subunit